MSELATMNSGTLCRGVIGLPNDPSRDIPTPSETGRTPFLRWLDGRRKEGLAYWAPGWIVGMPFGEVTSLVSPFLSFNRLPPQGFLQLQIEAGNCQLHFQLLQIAKCASPR